MSRSKIVQSFWDGFLGLTSTKQWDKVPCSRTHQLRAPGEDRTRDLAIKFDALPTELSVPPYLREVALFDCDIPWAFHQTFANIIKNKGELACYNHTEQFKKKNPNILIDLAKLQIIHYILMNLMLDSNGIRIVIFATINRRMIFYFML